MQWTTTKNYNNMQLESMSEFNGCKMGIDSPFVFVFNTLLSHSLCVCIFFSCIATWVSASKHNLFREKEREREFDT